MKQTRMYEDTWQLPGLLEILGQESFGHENEVERLDCRTYLCPLSGWFLEALGRESLLHVLSPAQVCAELPATSGFGLNS